jgi:nitronate monooxygenase
MWPDRRFLELVGVEHPVILAPMAGAGTTELAVQVAEAGGLGSIACAMLSADTIRAEIGIFRQRVAAPINVNFFCHTPPVPDPARDAGWRARLASCYRELGLDPEAPVAAANRAPFDDQLCTVVEEERPEIVSFHFGLPDEALLKRVKAAGAIVISSATTVAEARWLEARGVDAVIAQGPEAGGHRGIFLSDEVASQPGLFALLAPGRRCACASR